MNFLYHHNLVWLAYFGIAVGVELVIASLVGRFFNRARQEGWLFPREEREQV